MGLIWLTVLNIGVGILLAFVFFGKKTREIGQRLSAVTFPDLMCKIYRSPLLQYISGFIIVISMPLYTAAILIGGARFIEAYAWDQLHDSAFDLCRDHRGLRDLRRAHRGHVHRCLPGTIMFVGMAVLLVLTYLIVGGVNAGNAALTNMAGLVPAALGAQGMTGWTSMPALGSPIWFTLVTTICARGRDRRARPAAARGPVHDRKGRQVAQPCRAGRRDLHPDDDRRCLHGRGALERVLLRALRERSRFDAAGGNVDAVIPLFINEAMPDIFVALFMLTLLAAAMSTLSSLYHAMGTALICDLWGRGREVRPLPAEPPGRDSS